ncbi:MAG: glycerol kinase GlpK [Alphaproteobacteria bacterium]|nr:glycerol kinase GlpK [Alphaproteobacteria bacterium]
MSGCLLSIDQGTTSTRAILFDLMGNIRGVAQKELKLHYPHNGWVEQDAEDIWRDTQEVCRGALERSGVKASEALAIGITNQRETTVVWDRKTGRPLYNAIVWQDRRTADFCNSLKAHEDAVRRKTGLLLDPYFSATKIKWILDSVPDAREKARRGELAFGTIDSFLLWRLTGGKVHATDATNAARTLLFDVVRQDWDDDLLALFGVPRSMLPEVRDNSGLFGTTDVLGGATPVAGMAGDQQAALVGQACFRPGMVKSTYGTGCFALVNIGAAFRVSKNKMLTTVGYRLGGKVTYAIEGAIFAAGSAVQWLRDGLGIIKSAEESEALAQSVPDNGGVYMVPGFTGLGAPYWNPHARGAIVGLTRGSTAAHVVRAALEAQAYQTCDLLQAMADDAGHAIGELRVDGGMVRNSFVCQFLADMTMTPVLRPKVIETTALGAAYLAGLHVGVFSTPDDIQKNWQCERRFTPAMKEAGRERLYAGWSHAIRQILS